MSPQPYFDDGQVALYLGDCREILPGLGIAFDACVTDPPYGETSLRWDRWPAAWPALIATVTTSMWCFGSLRMLLDHYGDFTEPGWKLSHEIVWEKPAGTSMAADRFKRVHEFATHWYRGRWDGVRHDVPRERWLGANRGERHGGADRGEHFGSIRARTYEDDGTRLMRSVLRVAHMHGNAVHPTQKPTGIVQPLIEYACAGGGAVLDPFAGSGSTLEAARLAGRRAVGIEADEAYAEKAARRLSQGVLGLEVGER